MATVEGTTTPTTPVGRSRRRSPVAGRVRSGLVSGLWALLGVLILMALWEAVKALGQVVDLPFQTNDRVMPNVWTIAQGFFEPEVRGSTRTVGMAVLSAILSTMGLALGGFIIGVAFGLALAVVMQRFSFLERGLLPFVIASQTVPLIALAPLIVGFGNKISIGPWEWTTSTSVMFISAYLAFFPLSVGALRGLKALTPAAEELMRACAATPGQTLTRLRFPASVPYLVPALRVSAAASVVGAVVAEISTGVRGGIGRLILEYAREASSQPAKVYVAAIGAIVLGLIVAGLIALLDLYLTRNLPKEASA